LQWLLNCKGYPVAVPSHYGKKTSDAVKRFQMRAHLTPVDGTTGALTWYNLVNGSTKYGDHNDCVKALQVMLNSYRGDSGSGDLPITGYFGSQTSKSLRNYEYLRGLPISDTAGLTVWHSLLTSAVDAD
jgi:peptidoglycan hydrolase-like protein with peptidoglycan-binding domain